MIKKLILLLLVMCGGVVTANADGGKTVYFKPNSNWTQANAKFAVWQFGGTSADAWTNFSETANSEGYYTATLDEGYKKMIFVRYDGSATTPNWDWNNKSQDMPVPENDETYYTQIDNEWSYNVVGGDYYLCVSENPNGWTNATHYLMKNEGNFKYSVTIDNQTSTKCLYYMIVPSSAIIVDGTAWGNDPYNYGHLIYADTNNHDGNNPYDVYFANMTGNVGFGYWSRWKINNVKASFEFVFDRANMNFESKPYFTRTINAVESNGSYYATFSSDYNVAIPEGITAYYASETGSGKVTMMKFNEGEGIAATDAAFLKMDGTGKTYIFTPSTTTRSGNNLMKKPENGTVPANSYVFAKKSDGVGFYKTASELSNQQGKAYLSVQSQAPNLSIDIEGETTGIQVINLDTENTVNGQAYDLQGRRIDQPTKGLYIMNGKKYIVK